MWRNKMAVSVLVFCNEDCMNWYNNEFYSELNFKLFVSAKTSCSTQYYNVAFVNPERWLVKSRVYITQCKHGKFPATCKHGNFSYPSGFWHCYIIKNFSVLIRVISTLVKIGKTRNYTKTLRPSGVVFPHNFSFFHFPLVLIYCNCISTRKNVLYFLIINCFTFFIHTLGFIVYQTKLAMYNQFDILRLKTQSENAWL